MDSPAYISGSAAGSSQTSKEKRGLLSGASPALRLCLLICLLAGLAIGTTQAVVMFSPYGPAVATISGLAILIAALIPAILTTLILAALKRLRWQTSLVLVFSMILCATSTLLYVYIAPLMLFAPLAVYLAVMCFTGKYAGLKKAKRILRYCLLGLFGTLALASLVMMLWPGRALRSGDRPEAATLALPFASSVQRTDSALADPSMPGGFSYSVYYYAAQGQKIEPYPGMDAMPSKTADASAFLDGWSSLRTFLLGFDPGSLPLNAQVWMPDGHGPFPLALIVHGNHESGDRSDGGYAYLGELLASRGIIAASVDENFLNGSSVYDFLGFAGLNDENDARAFILLEHLRSWFEWNSDSSHPFYGKADFENLALIGHSRGGEAVAAAAAFAQLGYYPDNGALRFSYPFSVKTVVAIAPVHRQYDPAGLELELGGVNYLVLHGEHDMDVSSFMGANMFRRADVSQGGVKAQVWMQYANHGQFNSSWGAKDLSGLMNLAFNRRMLMPEAEQQRAAKVFIGAFLEATLLGGEEYSSLFRDFAGGASWLPPALYVTDYSDSRDVILDSFDSGFDLRVSSSGHVSYLAEGFDCWTQCFLPGKWENSNRALALSWGDGGSGAAAGHAPVFSAAFEPGTFSAGDTLIMSLCSGGSGDSAGVTFRIRLTDRDGNSALMSIDDFGGVARSIDAPIGKFPFSFILGSGEPVLQMVRIPTGRFSGLSGDIATMEWIFDSGSSGAGGTSRSGEQVLYVDDLRVARAG